VDHKIVFSKKIRTAVIGTIFLASQGTFVMSSHADSAPPGGQAAWNKYFSGAAIIPDPEENLEKLIDAPDPRCIPLQRKIISQTIQYGRDAYNSKASTTKKESDEILKSLRGLENTHDSCFDTVARAYLAISLHLLEPENSNVGSLLNNDRLDGHPFPNGLELTMLGAALLNHKNSEGSDIVEFLTPLRRTQESSQVWNQKTQGGSDFLVSAGYDCAERKILIDPYLPPLNLGATFVHELDHMFRDRVQVGETASNQIYVELLAARAALDAYSSGQTVAAVVDPLDAHLSLKLAMDETLASAVSAYYQRHMEWFHDDKKSIAIWLTGRTNHPLPFVLVDDLTLFRNDRKGPINEIWNLYSQVKSPEVINGEINLGPAGFLTITFLRGDPFFQPIDKSLVPMPEVHEIYQTIYRGYFNGASMSAADLALLDPSNQDSNRDPLTKWLKANRVDHSSDMNSTAPIRPDVDWIKVVASKDYDTGGFLSANPVARISLNLEVLFRGMDSVFSQLFDSDTLSPYCSQYLEGLKNGELNSYVGNSLSSGFKPGETGVKPGETGVKPGETGVKPGETGVKPGETGVKPELFRPCLNIGPEL
jgi:hypothetical protein